MIVPEVVDEERCLAEVVLDVLDVVLCALVTMSLPWQSKLQDPSVVCIMPPPASRGAMVVAEVVDALRNSAGVIETKAVLVL